MGFKEDLQKLAVQVRERMEYVTNEETTKHALVIPFIQVLGYDVFNPLEVRAEYDADFGKRKKKGEKVDYAIFKDGKPIIFIEVKSVTENLDNYDAQLARYFNAVPEVKLAILTNGVEYKFFTDLSMDNIMDDKPFFTFNILNIKETDIETLQRFKKERFDSEELVKHAEELVYMSALNEKLKDLLKNPSDDFIRFLIKDITNIRVTSNVIERFRPLVKKAISNAILDMVSQSLGKSEEEGTSKDIESAKKESSKKDEKSENVEDKDKPKRQIITTEEELKAYELVKEILKENNRDISQVNYKDTVNYFSIYNRGVVNWIVRFKLDSGNKRYMLTKLDVDELKSLCKGYEVDEAPKGTGVSRVYISGLEDIPKLKHVILKCYDLTVK